MTRKPDFGEFEKWLAEAGVADVESSNDGNASGVPRGWTTRTAAERRKEAVDIAERKRTVRQAQGAFFQGSDYASVQRGPRKVETFHIISEETIDLEHTRVGDVRALVPGCNPADFSEPTVEARDLFARGALTFGTRYDTSSGEDKICAIIQVKVPVKTEIEGEPVWLANTKVRERVERKKRGEIEIILGRLGFETKILKFVVKAVLSERECYQLKLFIFDGHVNQTKNDPLQAVAEFIGTGEELEEKLEELAEEWRQDPNKANVFIKL